MTNNPILKIQQLDYPWQTFDPFLLCAYLDDTYPRGDGQLGPAASLSGRSIGNDFTGKDGWRMYHGDKIPGFPSHPHRGFETVTIVLEGLVDHADSLGAVARFGNGDVQWLTAGKGIVHSEMFPLLELKRTNRLKMFQIWLNLPARSKLSEPRFKMMWAEDIPRRSVITMSPRGDSATTEIVCIAGRLDTGPTWPAGNANQSASPLAPPPNSWASQVDNDVAIWTIRMEPGARWTLPAAAGHATNRRLYFFAGANILVAGHEINDHAAIDLDSALAVEVDNIGVDVVEFLMLQGRPINEPISQSGPFVMNTDAELKQAFDDYKQTEFGGWPWPHTDPTHGSEAIRFARESDGPLDSPGDPSSRSANV